MNTDNIFSAPVLPDFDQWETAALETECRRRGDAAWAVLPLTVAEYQRRKVMVEVLTLQTKLSLSTHASE